MNYIEIYVGLLKNISRDFRYKKEHKEENIEVISSDPG